jgi:transposase
VTGSRRTDATRPDEAHEAVRELIRSREAAVDDLRRKRQAISSLMLRYGRTYPGKKTWVRVTGNGCRHSSGELREGPGGFACGQRHEIAGNILS